LFLYKNEQRGEELENDYMKLVEYTHSIIYIIRIRQS